MGEQEGDNGKARRDVVVRDDVEGSGAGLEDHRDDLQGAMDLEAAA